MTEVLEFFAKNSAFIGAILFGVSGLAMFYIKANVLDPLKTQIKEEGINRAHEMAMMRQETIHASSMASNAIAQLVATDARITEIIAKIQDDNVRIATEQGRQAERIHYLADQINLSNLKTETNTLRIKKMGGE